MWFGMMWWWVIPLVCFIIMRGHHQARWNRGRGLEREREHVAELRRVVEDQRGYIEELEARLTRVEDGLEFAERLLAERAVATGAAR